MGFTIGGLITIAALGLVAGTSIGSAAEKTVVPTANMETMMKGRAVETGPEKSKSPVNQQQCHDMQKDADMRQAMVGMMKQPEMQAMMKQVLAGDPEFRQMMLNLVNSAESSGSNNKPVSKVDGVDHNAHHSS